MQCNTEKNMYTSTVLQHYVYPVEKSHLSIHVYILN